MKSPFIACAIALGLFSSNLHAETLATSLQTTKHNIRIACQKDSLGDYSEDCTYQSWNKPRDIGQGQPDLEIKKGFFQMIRYPSCHFQSYDFLKGDTGIGITVMTYANLESSDHHPEYDGPMEKRADGMLEVLINDKRKARYWIHLK